LANPGFRNRHLAHLAQPKTLSGWWLTYPPEKYEFVSWDNEIPNVWKIKVMLQTTNQFSYHHIYLGFLGLD